MKNSADIMNYLINSYNYKSYLEIGIQNGYTFTAVKCEYKIGVDIEKKRVCPVCHYSLKTKLNYQFHHHF